METPVLLFYLFAALAVGSALGMVLNLRNTVAGAMCLVVTMVSLGGIYLLLEAYLVAALQMMVYGGAIVVLFLFVVMLLNLRQDDFAPARATLVRTGSVLLSLLALLGLLRVGRGLPAPPPVPPGFGGYAQMGAALYTDYVLLVEVISLLLLAAIVGALILAKRKID